MSLTHNQVCKFIPKNHARASYLRRAFKQCQWFYALAPRVLALSIIARPTVERCVRLTTTPGFVALFLEIGEISCECKQNYVQFDKLPVGRHSCLPRVPLGDPYRLASCRHVLRHGFGPGPCEGTFAT